MTPELSGLRVVQEDAALAETECHCIDWGAGQFINCRLHFLFEHGWFVHIDKRMPSVVVEKDAWFVHSRMVHVIDWYFVVMKQRVRTGLNLHRRNHDGSFCLLDI